MGGGDFRYDFCDVFFKKRLMRCGVCQSAEYITTDPNCEMFMELGAVVRMDFMDVLQLIFFIVFVIVLLTINIDFYLNFSMLILVYYQYHLFSITTNIFSL